MEGGREGGREGGENGDWRYENGELRVF